MNNDSLTPSNTTDVPAQPRMICHRCGTQFTIAEGKQIAHDHDLTADVVMCSRCQSIYLYSQSPAAPEVLLDVPRTERNLLIQFSALVVAVFSFIMLAWTAPIYDNVKDAQDKTNGHFLSGWDILTAKHGTYTFAESFGLSLIVAGLVLIALCLIISAITLKYELVLRYVRFVLALVVIAGCLLAAYHLHKHTNSLSSPNGINTSFQIQSGQSGGELVATCTVNSNGKGYCLSGSSSRRYPNYGFALVGIAALVLAFFSKFPTMIGVKAAMNDFTHASTMNLLTERKGL